MPPLRVAFLCSSRFRECNAPGRRAPVLPPGRPRARALGHPPTRLPPTTRAAFGGVRTGRTSQAPLQHALIGGHGGRLLRRLLLPLLVLFLPLLLGLVLLLLLAFVPRLSDCDSSCSSLSSFSSGRERVVVLVDLRWGVLVSASALRSLRPAVAQGRRAASWARRSGAARAPSRCAHLRVACAGARACEAGAGGGALRRHGGGLRHGRRVRCEGAAAARLLGAPAPAAFARRRRRGPGSPREGSHRRYLARTPELMLEGRVS